MVDFLAAYYATCYLIVTTLITTSATQGVLLFSRMEIYEVFLFFFLFDSCELFEAIVCSSFDCPVISREIRRVESIKHTTSTERDSCLSISFTCIRSFLRFVTLPPCTFAKFIKLTPAKFILRVRIFFFHLYIFYLSFVTFDRLMYLSFIILVSCYILFYYFS